jgi:hypothetical protein
VVRQPLLGLSRIGQPTDGMVVASVLTGPLAVCPA